LNAFPLAQQVMQGTCHHLIVLGKQAQVLDVDLLQQVVDVNLLDCGGYLFVKLLVFEFKLSVLLLIEFIFFREAFVLSGQFFFQSLQLRISYLELDDLFAVSVCKQGSFLQILPHLVELLLLLYLLIEHVLSFGLFFLQSLHDIVGSLLLNLKGVLDLLDLLALCINLLRSLLLL